MAKNLQTTDLEDWEEIGEEVNRVSEDVTSLVRVLDSIPKTVWRDEFNKTQRGMSQLKDVLDSRMFKEHPEEASTQAFYGPADRKE